MNAQFWCPNCKMLVTPKDRPSITKAMFSDNFSVGRYVVGGSDYIAGHIIRKESPQSELVGKKCPKCGKSNLVLEKPRDNKKTREAWKKFADKVKDGSIKPIK